eukprot:TRINITY_DN49186_c0_g1_i1.p2 TRINITY_DN49186_c0_g1~~TRINITY_DN49186_c0_g1_i1.p2  ORF type:complete len:375 (+),score=154.12 TRINITY_DN49186_c0_g1_i1:100-1224(+)
MMVMDDEIKTAPDSPSASQQHISMSAMDRPHPFAASVPASALHGGQNSGQLYVRTSQPGAISAVSVGDETPRSELSPSVTGYDANQFKQQDSLYRLHKKITGLVSLIKRSSHVVLITGEELGLEAGVPEYDSPMGIWKLRERTNRSFEQDAISSATPTFSHMAIKELVKRGHIKYVVTTAIDGLHMRSGVKRRRLCELQGSVYREMCQSCRKHYIRVYNCAAQTCDRKPFTGRLCENPECFGRLRHALVNIASDPGSIRSSSLANAQESIRRCDLLIVLGVRSYNQVLDSFITSHAHASKRLYIIGEKESPHDALAFMRIFTSVHTLMDRVAKYMAVDVPQWREEFAVSDVVGSEVNLDLTNRHGPKQSKCVIL